MKCDVNASPVSGEIYHAWANEVAKWISNRCN